MLIASVTAVLLFAAACGDDGSDDGADSSGEQSTTTTEASGTTTTADAGPDEGTTTTGAASDSGGSILGEPDPAEGEPVKVGFAFDGQTPSIDNSQHEPVARAVVQYLNDYGAGIGGRPIELVVCAGEGDPGKATACANEFVQEGVVLTLMPENQQGLAVYTVMDANDIPVFVYGVTEPAITEDPDSAFMIASLTAGLSLLPIDVAKEEGADRVAAIVVDVPAATDFYVDGSSGAQNFADAGIEMDLVRAPLGAPDISQQINQVVSSGAGVAHIVGDPGLCINAINGLRTFGFEGKITVLNGCATEAVLEAVGENIDGVIMASPTPIGDTENAGNQLYDAILEEYDVDIDDPREGLTTFITIYSAWQAAQGVEGDVTAATVGEAIRTMPEQPLVTGAGLGFQCGGTAAPETPAVCTRGTLRVTLDAAGDPILPYTAFGE